MTPTFLTRSSRAKAVISQPSATRLLCRGSSSHPASLQPTYPLTRLIRRPTKITIHTGGESSRSTSYNSEEEDSSQHEQDFSIVDEEDWETQGEYYDEEVLPSDSASASNEPPTARPRPARTASRHHRLTRQEAHYPPVQASAPHPPSVDPSEDYGVPYGHAFQPQPAHHRGGGGGYYGGRGHPHQYSQSQASHYMGGYPAGNQMVPYNNYGPNPFSPMGNSSNGASYFGAEPPRHMYDMMPYQHGYYAAPQYNLPAHMQQFHLSPHPGPATEGPGPAAGPGHKKPPPDIENLRIEARLVALKAQEDKQKAALEFREMQEHFRRQTEDALSKTNDEIKRARDEAQRDIERAKEDAEKAAKARIEADRKAAEERARIEQLAEENAKRKFEAEMKAAEERRQREQEERVRIEEAANARLKAALQAEADAKVAAEKKAAEEAERLKRIEEDARRKAELEYLAKVEAEKEAAKKAAEAEEAARRKAEADFLAKVEAEKLAAQKAAEAEEAMRRKAESDYLAKVEAEKAAAQQATEAEEAAKKKLADEARASLEAAKKTDKEGSIKFKDAVGRKFSFPFHICQTWQVRRPRVCRPPILELTLVVQGMEDLIKQAFLHVDVIGPHVQEGHYDLIGPDNEIILPSVWEKVVQPEWSISMTMWPVEKTPQLGPRLPMDGRRGYVPGAAVPPPPPAPGAGMSGRRPMPTGIPPGWPGPARDRRPTHLPDNVNIIDVDPHPVKTKSGNKKNSAMLTFFAGKPTKRK